MRRRVVITGIGVVSPIGIGVAEFVSALERGVSGASGITGFDASGYSATFACEVKNFAPENYIDKKKVKRLARFSQMALVAAAEAVKSSGIDFSKTDRSRCGVVTGTGIGGLEVIENEYRNLLEKGPRRISPFLIPMIITNIAPGEIAIENSINGPNYAVTSACASSNHAIGDAMLFIRNGSVDVMITGGAEAAITPLGFGGFCSIKALSTRNDDPTRSSRPFDKDRDGFVMGEGAAMFVIESLEHARKRGAKILAELVGYGASDDAYHITAPAPDGAAAVLAMESAIRDALISKDEVNYFNAHGTSTQLNDKTETLAIKKVFGERAKQIPISSTKSMTGHLLGAAGAVELAASALCMEAGFIHPTINYVTPDPECDLDYVPNVPRRQPYDCFISNSLGFGGHNAALVAKKFRE
ncbi:MAG: beta-ketoacyl-ACP synthase II [Endomicrobiia bacterium]|nr:beta-ketoacyl-ACP synthase II [Endomicrobiia bacterium]